jgi:hypothetical protein
VQKIGAVNQQLGFLDISHVKHWGAIFLEDPQRKFFSVGVWQGNDEVSFSIGKNKP